jgi:hypothetical protein
MALVALRQQLAICAKRQDVQFRLLVGQSREKIMSAKCYRSIVRLDDNILPSFITTLLVIHASQTKQLCNASSPKNKQIPLIKALKNLLDFGLDRTFD